MPIQIVALLVDWGSHLQWRQTPRVDLIVGFVWPLLLSDHHCADEAVDEDPSFHHKQEQVRNTVLNELIKVDCMNIDLL